MLLLLCISFHDDYRDDVTIDGHHQQQLQLSFSLSTIVVDAVTNTNDTIAMFAFRQAFNNFTGSNWYLTNDPCAPSPGESDFVFFFYLSLSF
jgi:hypothetical protein